MRSLPPARTGLLALALLAAASTAHAAPVPVKAPLPKFEKYLLDDTDFVAVVNVQQALASPLFTKGLQKQVQTLLKGAEAQALLKDSGFDPLKDVDYAVLFAGRSCYSGKELGSNGPLVLLFGRFDEKKLHAKMAALAKAKGGKVKAVEAGGAKMYEVEKTGYVALLDKNTAAYAPRKEQLAELFAKAAGKKTTKLKHKETAAALKAFKPGVAVQAVALEQMVHCLKSTTTVEDGMGKREVTEVTWFTVGEVGIKALRVTGTADETLRLTVVLTPKGKAGMTRLAKEIPDGLKSVAAEGRQEAEKDKSLLPLVQAIEKAKVKAGADTITLEFEGDAKVVQVLSKLLWEMVTEFPPPPG